MQLPPITSEERDIVHRVEARRLALSGDQAMLLTGVGGLSLTPEFAAMLAGLSFYYAANTAETISAKTV